eukprot:1146078-Pelagomonas_calceolata.AAC.10
MMNKSKSLSMGLKGKLTQGLLPSQILSQMLKHAGPRRLQGVPQWNEREPSYILRIQGLGDGKWLK